MGKKCTILVLLFETLCRTQAVLSSVQVLHKYTIKSLVYQKKFIQLVLNHIDKCQHLCSTQHTHLCHHHICSTELILLLAQTRMSFHPGKCFPITQGQIRKCVKWISAQNTKLYIHYWKNMSTCCLKKKGINYRPLRSFGLAY